jgi:hypothetical protein
MYPNFEMTELPHDQELAKRVSIALAIRQRAGSREITVQVESGIVTLRGNVPSFFDRQLAFETARRVAGVHQVHVELVVVDGTERKESLARKTRPLNAGEKGSTLNVSQRFPTTTSVACFESNERLSTLRTGMVGLIVVVLAITTGCGGGGPEVERLAVHPVSGLVKLNGKPVADAYVALHPKVVAGTPQGAADSESITPHGKTDASGKFTITTYDAHDGAPEGEYAVTVQKYKRVEKNGSSEPGPNILPKRFAKPTTSKVSIRIATGANELPAIELR